MAYKYSPPPGGNPSATRGDIENEFRKWNDQAGGQVVTDWDLPFAKDRVIAAEVVFALRGAKVPVRIDRWDSFAVNLKCCFLVIRDMRLAESRGAEQAARAAYMALPAPSTQKDPWEVLGLRPGASPELIDAAYKTLAQAAHPDRGGSSEKMAELNDARERAKAMLTPPPEVR